VKEGKIVALGTGRLDESGKSVPSNVKRREVIGY
jgi:co-chaperonin GroES (HSP10)